LYAQFCYPVLMARLEVSFVGYVVNGTDAIWIHRKFSHCKAVLYDGFSEILGRGIIPRTVSIWMWRFFRVYRVRTDLGLKRWHVSDQPCGCRVHFTIRALGVMPFFRIGFATTNNINVLHATLKRNPTEHFVYFYILDEQVGLLDVTRRRDRLLWWNCKALSSRMAVRLIGAECGQWEEWTDVRVSLSLLGRVMTLSMNDRLYTTRVPRNILTNTMQRYLAVQVGPHQGYDEMLLVPRFEVDCV